MREHTYYIDPMGGDDGHDGLAPARPFKTYAQRQLAGGDTVLFKRGSVMRDMLHTRDGDLGAPITYGAYGQGSKPTFLGSVAADEPASWVEERPTLWRYRGTFASEVCNLIFNGGESCGNLRWRIEDLQQPGEWHYTGIGVTSAGESWGGDGQLDGVLYLCSPDNPGYAYRSIECALWGERKLAGGQRHIVLENLSFRNGGVHGFHAVQACDITIRYCDFGFIGGAVWHRERRIRFGNAVELWDGACDVTVEHCVFDNIYDAGVTHQGGETRNIPERLYFRDNLFLGCGLAAYECREPSQEVYFEHNTCISAGGGFSLQGELPPRQSEIYPQPMGHHVFIWRIEPGTQPGRVMIRHNVFYQAPLGAAIYSIVAPVDEDQFVLDDNGYWQPTGELLARWGGRDYARTEFASYQANSGQDANSRLVKPAFVDPSSGDYRQRPDSPCVELGMRSATTP